jgi:hypothetical protein
MNIVNFFLWTGWIAGVFPVGAVSGKHGISCVPGELHAYYDGVELGREDEARATLLK